jgi:periplasmic protein TonB
VNAPAESLPIVAAVQEGQAPVKDRLTTTMFLAALFHGIIILGVTFAVPRGLDPPAPTLEVLLTMGEDTGEPDNLTAEYLSDRNQIGSGNTSDDVRPANPASSLLPFQQAGTADGNGTEYLDATLGQKASEFIAAKSDQSDFTSRDGKPKPAQRAESPVALAQVAPSPVATDATDDSLRLRGREDGEYEVIPNTRESKIAPYLDSWRNKVERLGTLNFPRVMRAGPAPGNPVLEVSIRSDGKLQSVLIRRSSGRKELDQSAIDILRLASPFDPFPAELGDLYDELRFAYEWQFLPGGGNRGTVSVPASEVRD